MTTPTSPPEGPACDTGRDFSALWYLAYFGMLAFQPAFDPTATVVDWTLAGVFVVVGGFLYLLGEFRPRRRLAATVALAVVGAVAVFFNTGAAVYFVYAAALAGTFQPRARAQRWILGLAGALVVLALFSPVPLPYRILSFAFPLLFVWIVGSQVIVDAERERESTRLRIDNARIERLATLGERERIARDLHDLLGHTLTGILVRAQLIRRLAASDPERAAGEVADIEELARGALGEVRSTVSGWRHHALDAEIDAARAALAAADVDPIVERDDGLSLSPAVEAALALAVREAVTNVVRHAAAGRCTIGIVASGDQVMLTVADDGGGTTAPDGSGLAGMRERIAALGGEVERRMQPGTTLKVTVPAQEVAG